ncbi:purine-binding chemotaxis protein CheW [Ligilactobacillus sp. WC1T17]|uniref:Purine-binding chemotaxis protein CheW n=1 Tax=Ligilactobacillus ruminis TaxID=1623 RepID=A0ABY1AAZ8_9LACO|nr:purine-binding chemotaxis protein CheW [Ligilactobacillus ruminis]
MQMIMFKMDEENYLISAKSVEEIIDTVPITYVPLAPNWIKGLINLRGNVMTVVDLSELIGIPSPEKCLNILIMKNENNEEDRKGLLIEEVSEVVDINPDDIELPPEKAGDTAYIGVVSLGDKVANVVDVTKMIFEDTTAKA